MKRKTKIFEVLAKSINITKRKKTLFQTEKKKYWNANCAWITPFS